MKLILFQIHFCGMSLKDYSKKIMICRPFRTISNLFTLKFCSKNQIKTVSDLVSQIKYRNSDQIRSISGEFGVSNFSIPNVYIEHKGYLFGLKHDKSLSEIFLQFKKLFVVFDIFIVIGGASREYNGYKFIVNSDEYIHKFDQPHVHVKKCNTSPRYDLQEYKRFPNDEYLQDHVRDEKKIIVPYLKKHRSWFIEKWNLATKGYIPPIETIDGRQLCRES